MRLLREFLARAGVAVVGLSLFFGLAYVGGWWFVCVVAILSIVALSEYYSAIQTTGVRPNVELGWFCAIFILVVTQIEQNARAAAAASTGADGAGAGLEATGDVLQLTLAILLFCAAGTLVANFRARKDNSVVTNTATTVFGVVYLGVLLSFVLRMKYVDVPAFAGNEAAGEFARRVGGLILVVAAVWLSDTAAFLAGNLWGRIKLAPRISPGKTVEGSAAGLIAAVLGAVAVGSWLGLSVGQSAPLGLIMGLLGQLGDLSKSVLKRDIGIKDFGTMFGPHGGVIDRFDSVLFSMPFVYWYFWFLPGVVPGG